MDMPTHQIIYVEGNHEFICDFDCGIKIDMGIEWFGKLKPPICWYHIWAN